MVSTVLDVSHWQNDRGPIDWQMVARAGISGVLVKATQGSGYVDAQHAANVAGARAAGLLVGHYHYAGASGSQPGSPAAEAAWFLRNVDHRPGELLVLDYEPGRPPGNPDEWCAQFLAAVRETTGVRPLLYMNESTARGLAWTRTRGMGTPLWVARYGVNNGQVPSVALNVGSWGAPALWQYTDRGEVAGVVGAVDLNVCYLDELTWHVFGGGLLHEPTPAPAPVPVPAAFDLAGWRARRGATGPIFVHLQHWGNETFPAYCKIAAAAPAYGPATQAFLRELAHRAARDLRVRANRADLTAADGANIGDDLAAVLVHYGFGRYLQRVGFSA